MHTGKTDTEAMKIKPNQKDKSLVAKTHRPTSIQSITHVHYVPHEEEETDREHSFEWLESRIRVIEDIYHTKLHTEILYLPVLAEMLDWIHLLKRQAIQLVLFQMDYG